ncbi:hypothetical protein [Streptomyces mirabilis]|uniref:hypothetical protein n=1 Tax=Streptomyces mirabilis TaxID=68239 RepID=UPI0033A0AC9C
MLVVVALVWTVQLVALVAALSGVAQADIAIHFRTTDIAWFTRLTDPADRDLLPALRGQRRGPLRQEARPARRRPQDQPT